MEILWFVIVTFMITMYVVLDGFDLGVGIVHLIVGKNDDERRLTLKTIGPVWDANEVWLLAAAGTLYFAFPRLYASSFSGFYLPLIIVLWLLMLRGLGIEFRHQVDHSMWRLFWDVVFSLSSVLLAIFFGAALGNVVRGVPLNKDGYFFEPLWTTFTVVPEAGILDWFTILIGFVAFCTLMLHGSHYISMKTEGTIQKRSRSAAASAWWGTFFTSLAALIATSSIRPETWNNFSEHQWGYIFPVTGMLGLGGAYYFRVRRNDTAAFLSSATFITSMLASTAFGLYPNVLPSSIDASHSLTVHQAAASEYGLRVGIVWWTAGIGLAVGYFSYVYRSFRGKVSGQPEESGY